jgi:hypothetical protein
MAKKKGAASDYVQFSAVSEVEYLASMVEATKEDANKFDGGNKTAGTRLRAQLKSIKDKAFSMRKEVIEARKARE